MTPKIECKSCMRILYLNPERMARLGARTISEAERQLYRVRCTFCNEKKFELVRTSNSNSAPTQSVKSIQSAKPKRSHGILDFSTRRVFRQEIQRADAHQADSKNEKVEEIYFEPEEEKQPAALSSRPCYWCKKMIEAVRIEIFPEAQVCGACAQSNEKVTEERSRREAARKCPKCSGRLTPQKGQYGPYLRCQACKGTVY